MYTATTRTFGIQSFLQCGLITWVMAVMSVGSFDNSNQQLFLGQPLQLAGRKVYFRNELLALRDYDVTPARSVRKVIFYAQVLATRLFCVFCKDRVGNSSSEIWFVYIHRIHRRQCNYLLSVLVLLSRLYRLRFSTYVRCCTSTMM
jgi:hypothetical protein